MAEIKTARFWIWWNDGWVKITLRDGQSVRYGRFGYHDEGWESEEEQIKREGDWLHRVTHTDGTDCDGRLERFSRCKSHILSDRGFVFGDDDPGRVPHDERELGGGLEPVQRFITLAATRIRVEVTTLVVPGANDSEAEIEAMARWIASVDRTIPYHLSCYYPQYRYDAPPTPQDLVFSLADVARRHLPHVYVGNVGLRELITSCPACGAPLIRRTGYTTRILGVKDGVCGRCGHDPGIPGLD